MKPVEGAKTVTVRATLTRLGQRVDLLPGHVPVEQPLPGRLEQRPRPPDRLRVGAALAQPFEVLHRAQELPLRGDQLRAVDLEEHVALRDGLADVVHAGPLDPALVLGLHRDDAFLVVRQDPDGADGDGERAAVHHGGADREVLQEAPADPDAAVGGRFVRVDRDEVHPHGRLAGPVGGVVGVHRGAPVEDLALAGGIGGRVLARHGHALMGFGFAGHRHPLMSAGFSFSGHGHALVGAVFTRHSRAVVRPVPQQQRRPPGTDRNPDHHEQELVDILRAVHDPSSCGNADPMARSISANVFM